MALLILIATFSILAWLSQYNDFCEILCHFRVIYFWMSVILVAPTVLIRRRLVLFTWNLTIVLVTLPMVPFYTARPHDSIIKGAQRTKILQANLWGGKNRNFEAVVGNVHKFDPDVFVTSENTKMWSNYFDSHLPEYKYKIVENQHGGIAVYSKLPLENPHIECFGEKQRPRIETIVRRNGVSLFLIATPHWFRPSTCIHQCSCRSGKT